MASIVYRGMKMQLISSYEIEKTLPNLPCKLGMAEQNNGRCFFQIYNLQVFSFFFGGGWVRGVRFDPDFSFEIAQFLFLSFRRKFIFLYFLEGLELDSCTLSVYIQLLKFWWSTVNISCNWSHEIGRLYEAGAVKAVFALWI